MSHRIKMKKTISMMLMLTLILSVFGGIVNGPDSKAVAKSELGIVGMTCVNFDATGEDYNDLSMAKLYEDDSVGLVFKRKTGCRIPAGSFIYVYYENDFNDFRQDGYYPWTADDNGYTVRYRGNNLKRSTDQTCWFWSRPWKPGNYRVCLIVPYLGDDGKAAFTWYSYKIKINRYG